MSFSRGSNPYPPNSPNYDGQLTEIKQYQNWILCDLMRCLMWSQILHPDPLFLSAIVPDRDSEKNPPSSTFLFGNSFLSSSMYFLPWIDFFVQSHNSKFRNQFLSSESSMNKKNRFYEKSRKSCKILLSRNSSFTQFRQNEGQTKIIRKLSGHFFTNFSIWDPSPFRKKSLQ